MIKNYRLTLHACYLGFITQAIVANFPTLLYVHFHDYYGISYGTIAFIPLVFYCTQILVDLFCANFADKIGYRVCIVAAQILSGIGMILLAVLPGLCPEPFVGIIVSVVLYATGSGLIETLVSPVVEACPFDRKEQVMSLLHSFYCWGTVGVIVVSSIFFFLFGTEKWQILCILLSLIPLVNVVNFLRCPIERLTEQNTGYTVRTLMSEPLFRIALILMICAGASELSMAQWASAYVESSLGLPKSLGDLLGPCLFACAAGLSRVIFSRFGNGINLPRVMTFSGLLCLVSYLLSALCSLPAFGLAGCILCGFSTGIMWPGTISVFSRRIPLGGTTMFALLAAAGDIGGSAGPWLVGVITERFGDQMRVGILCSCVFPLVLIICLQVLRFHTRAADDK